MDGARTVSLGNLLTMLKDMLPKDSSLRDRAPSNIAELWQDFSRETGGVDLRWITPNPLTVTDFVAWYNANQEADQEPPPVNYRIKRVREAIRNLKKQSRPSEISGTDLVYRFTLRELERAVFLLDPGYDISEDARKGWCTKCDSFNCNHTEATP